MDDVYWKAALACFVLFSSFVRPSKERGRAVFVRSPSSIEYRYSLSPSPLSAFLPFFFPKTNCVSPVFCFTVRCLTTYALISFASSPLDSLIASAKKPPARSYSPMDIVSHRTILQYVSLFFKETDKPLYSNCHSAVYVFRESGCSKVPGVRYSILIIHPSLVHYDPACR